jgi:hypothetical protein
LQALRRSPAAALDSEVVGVGAAVVASSVAAGAGEPDVASSPQPASVSTAPFNHRADAAFDDGVIGDGAVLLASLAQRRLAAATAPASS